MLILALDTATSVATVALVDHATLGERTTAPRRVLADVEELLSAAGRRPHDVELIAVGTGPGSFTSIRMGLVTARALSLSLEAPVAGVGTLDALAAGAPGALPVLDGRRREIFTLCDGTPACLAPAELAVTAGQLLVGDGAVLYRELFEGLGGVVPADDDPRHVPWARHHASLATAYGPAELVEPIYLRAPDADRALERKRRT